MLKTFVAAIAGGEEKNAARKDKQITKTTELFFLEAWNLTHR